mgnify:CR=1 FL=1
MKLKKENDEQNEQVQRFRPLLIHSFEVDGNHHPQRHGDDEEVIELNVSLKKQRKAANEQRPIQNTDLFLHLHYLFENVEIRTKNSDQQKKINEGELEVEFVAGIFLKIEEGKIVVKLRRDEAIQLVEPEKIHAQQNVRNRRAGNEHEPFAQPKCPQAVHADQSEDDKNEVRWIEKAANCNPKTDIENCIRAGGIAINF